MDKSMNIKREDFNEAFPDGSELRELAKEIAGLGFNEAKDLGILKANPPPYNFLANGETETNDYGKIELYCPLGFAKWKFGKDLEMTGHCCELELSKFEKDPKKFGRLHGFGENKNESVKGLSFLFDPLVDAFLAPHFLPLKENSSKVEKEAPEGTAPGTVIVLSDYGAIGDTDNEIINYNDNDEKHKIEWAEHIMNDVLKVNSKQDNTTKNILSSVYMDKEKWKENSDLICKSIREKNVYVWNFFPFMRGGKSSTDAKALPKKEGGCWNKCSEWLLRFATSLNVKNIVICTNAVIRKRAFGNVARTGNKKIKLDKLLFESYQSLFNKLCSEFSVYVLYHPSSSNWITDPGDGLGKDCETLKKILDPSWRREKP